MRIFISSVKAGLEEERRALPGLLKALGHEPITFETFGARTEPSRQECLEAVEGSDVYLLLLGPYYGHVFRETGQSATHDEFVAARTAGIPRMVFHKTGAEPDAEQTDFIRMVGDYGSGSFWADYATVPELQILVAEAVRKLESAPSPLEYDKLDAPPVVEWKDEWPGGQVRGWGHTSTFAELHVTPLAGGTRSARQMADLSDPLISKLRTYGVLSQASGAEVDASDAAVAVTVPTVQRRHDESTPHRLAGVRVTSTGQVSAWTTLPHDNMGALVDADDLATTFAEQLRVIGALNVLEGDRFAISAGLGGSMTLISIAKPGAQRSRAAIGLGSDQPVRVDPDESVSSAAFDGGAADVARMLARTVLSNFRQ